MRRTRPDVEKDPPSRNEGENVDLVDEDPPNEGIDEDEDYWSEDEDEEQEVCEDGGGEQELCVYPCKRRENAKK